jgi:hypothetical protein
MEMKLTGGDLVILKVIGLITCLNVPIMSCTCCCHDNKRCVNVATMSSFLAAAAALRLQEMIDTMLTLLY